MVGWEKKATMATEEGRFGRATVKGFCCPVILSPPTFSASELPAGLAQQPNGRPFMMADWGDPLELQIPFIERMDIEEALDGVELNMRNEPRRLTETEEATLGPVLEKALPRM